MIYFCYKTKKEVNCIEPSSSVSVPCLRCGLAFSHLITKEYYLKWKAQHNQPRH